MFNQLTKGFIVTVVVLVLAILTLFVLSLTYGLEDFTMAKLINLIFGQKLSRGEELIFFQFRLPRLIVASLVGMGLGIAGAVLQGISRNGLADPGILGINAGAGLAVIIFMYCFQPIQSEASWFAVLVLPFWGLAGGLGTAIVVYLLSRQSGAIEPQRFLLVGIAVGMGMSALSLYVTLKMNPSDFHMATIWSTGSIIHFDWKHIMAILPWFLILIPFIFWKSHILDVFQLDESSVKSLGVRVNKEQGILLLSSAGLISACVSVAGNISFVGLVIPHIAKGLMGNRHRQVIPLCALLGMFFVLLADFVAKNALAPMEMSVGIVISLIGAPYFIYLLCRK